MASYQAGLPLTFGRYWLARNVDRWSEPFGAELRRMQPSSAAFPTSPVSALLGFASGATQREDTGTPRASGEYANPLFREVGYLGTESGWTFVGAHRAACAARAGRAGFRLAGSNCTLGPSPNPDPALPYSNWARWANHPYVTRPDMLGRAASLAQHGWYAISDQTAVGLVNLRWHGGMVADALPAALRPSRPDSIWGVVQSFWGWSAGDGLAASHIGRWQSDLVRVPEVEKLAVLARCIADAARVEASRWGARSHRNPAYSLLRLLQKLFAGWLLARRVGDNPAWFAAALGALGEDADVVLDLLGRAAYGVTIPEGVPEVPRRPTGRYAPSGNPALVLPSSIPLPAPTTPFGGVEFVDKSVRLESDFPEAQDLLPESMKWFIKSYGPSAEKAFYVDMNTRYPGPGGGDE